jgi:WD40 repeat protein
VSGGEDRLVKVWDLASGRERLSLRVQQESFQIWAGGCAVAISPDGNHVASADSQVRLWDISQGRQHVHVKVLEPSEPPASGFLQPFGAPTNSAPLMLGAPRLIPGVRSGDMGLSVRVLAFAPDGRTLVSSKPDGKFNVWEVGSGRLIQSLEIQPDRWQSLAFGPDGLTMAAAGLDHGLVIWDTRGWTIRHRTRFDSMATALAFTHDGQRLAVALGLAVRMIDPATGGELRRFDDQSHFIAALALSPDDQIVAAACPMVKSWELATGAEQKVELTGHNSAVQAIAFSPDGTMLATGSSDRTVRLWDLGTRQERMTLSVDHDFVQSLAFRPDGRALAALLSDQMHHELILWELPSGKQLRTWREGTGWRLAFSADGRWLASRSNIVWGSPTLWDPSTGRVTSEFELGQGKWGVSQGSFVFSPDSKRLIFAGEVSPSSRMTSTRCQVILWDIEKERTELAIEDERLPGQVAVSALSPDGQILAIGGTVLVEGKRSPKVCLWSMTEERPLHQLDQHATHLAFSSDGRTLLGFDQDGEARTWDPQSGRLREIIRVCESGYPAVHDVAMAPDGHHFAAAMNNGTVRIFRLQPASP